MKVRFTQKTDERVHGAAYDEGDVVDLPYPSAMRWLRRHLAVEVTAPPVSVEPVRLRGRPMMESRKFGSAGPTEAPKPFSAPTEVVEKKAEEKPDADEKPKSRRGRPKKRA